MHTQEPATSSQCSFRNAQKTTVHAHAVSTSRSPGATDNQTRALPKPCVDAGSWWGEWCDPGVSTFHISPNWGLPSPMTAISQPQLPTSPALFHHTGNVAQTEHIPTVSIVSAPPCGPGSPTTNSLTQPGRQPGSSTPTERGRCACGAARLTSLRRSMDWVKIARTRPRWRSAASGPSPPGSVGRARTATCCFPPRQVVAQDRGGFHMQAEQLPASTLVRVRLL